MKTSIVLSMILTVVCIAAQAVQSDWTLGSGTTGPTGNWGSCFDSCQDISWLAVPGQLALASVQLEETVFHAVDNSFEGAYTVDVGDLNGDGLNDIIGGGSQSPQFCAWYADGSGGWVEGIISSTADSPTGCDIVDIDDDGDPDILCATYYGGRVLLFLNDGSPTPMWTEVVISQSFAGGHDVESFDMDNDGDPDILAAAAEGDRVTWWRNDGGTPIVWHEQDISTSVNYPCRIQACDLDGDGLMDVVASMWLGDNIVAWYGSGGGDPTWTEQLIYYPVYGAHSVRASDVDLDGDPDLIASSLDEGRVLLFRNGGGIPVQWTREVISSQLGCGYARPGDIDGDGDYDVIASSFGSGGAFWYENTAGGTSWMRHPIATDLGSIACSLPADVDGDGDLDAVLTCRGSGRILWYEMTEFKPSGWLISSILDTGENPQWASIDWSCLLPSSTGFSVSYRTSDDPDAMGDWSLPFENPMELSGLLERYFQYRIEMDTSDPSISPVLESLQLNWDPTGVNGQGEPSGLTLTLVGGNPVRGSVIVRLEGSWNCCVELGVYDCSGRLVWSDSRDLEENSEEFLQISNLPDGSYRIHMREASGTVIALPVIVLDR